MDLDAFRVLQEAERIIVAERLAVASEAFWEAVARHPVRPVDKYTIRFDEPWPS